uniref:Uncharacterized protein n=1 Tax=Ananas comosus var. bracteatus TaxID=296719 RepID=A0A6V7PU43_ANACO|nr:unnamed protein product [Ananas comosus var. bracteatus]
MNTPETSSNLRSHGGHASRSGRSAPLRPAILYRPCPRHFLRLVSHFSAPTVAESNRPPVYKPDQKSGPVRIPGSVPFLWEHSPGRPKPSPTGPGPTPVQFPPVRPPPRTAHSVRTRGPVGGSEHEEASHADAHEALSRTDSFLVNCSLSGVADYADHPRVLYADDAPACDFIMGRFLPAAQALAGGPRPQNHANVENASACEREPTNLPPFRGEIPCGGPDFVSLGGRSSRGDEYEQKLEERNQAGRSQLNTESNWILDWTSSQMADWAFPFPHSTFQKGNLNPAFQKTLSEDLKESSAGKDDKVEGNLTAESRGSDALQHNSSGAADPRLQISPNSENAKHDISEDSAALLPCKLQLLLPKSPSDSWLSRVLPSVSSKKLPARSFLVLRSPPKKQATRALLDPKPDL